jgi:quercetin dioxygenase-like cupin family protein
MNRFVPQELSFEQGSERIHGALRKAKLDMENTIVTSRDPWAAQMREELRMTNQPSGVEMWQLPVVLNQSLLFMQVLAPGAEVPQHAHVRSAVFRLVISGSIVYDGKELKAGDWMYVPQGQSYSFAAGSAGATVMYPHPEPWRTEFEDAGMV